MHADFPRLAQYQPHSQGSPLPYSLAPRGRVEENPGIEVGSIQISLNTYS